MGNNNCNDCENLNNPKEKMDQSTFNMLIKEFNKERNVIKKFDNDELIRVEYKKGGKKHYYFNFSSFFDPEHGFLKSLSDLYERYKEVKEIDDVMPFAKLLFSPLEKIQETLKIKPGEPLFESFDFVYSCVLGISIGSISCGLMCSGNIILTATGAILYAGSMGLMIYETIKGSKEINKYQILDGEEDQLINQIYKFFGSEICEHLEHCNILEIVVTESYSLLPGIFYALTESNKNDQKVFINYWRLNNFPKAKFFSSLSTRQQKLYSEIFELMKTSIDSRSYSKKAKNIYKNYRETYKKAKEIVKENNNLKEEKKRMSKILKEIEEISKTEPNSARLQELLDEMQQFSE